MLITPSEPEFWSDLALLGQHAGWQSPLHTHGSLNYYKQRPTDEGKKIQDHSFILLWEKEPVVALISATVESNERSDLLAYEVPCLVVENKAKLTTKATKSFLREFEQVLEQVNGKVWLRDYLIDGEISPLSQHLMAKGASASPIFSKVIDLSEEAARLKSQVRKSYGSLINWGLRELKPIVITQAEVFWEHLLQFRELHIREAGSETRSIETWRRQYECVQNGEGFLVLGFLVDDLVSAGYFANSQTNCYYGVSASRRDLFDKPLFHSLMWTAILHAKQIGCRWFEVGEQVFPNHPKKSPPTQKEVGISEFKAGFGGQTRAYLDIVLDCG